MWTLAQRNVDTNWWDGAEVALWMLVVIAAAAAMFAAVVLIKRKLDAATPHGDAPPFTLEELRRLHRNGDLTDAQYEKARSQVIAKTTQAAGLNEQEEEADESETANQSSVATDDEGDEPDKSADEP